MLMIIVQMNANTFENGTFIFLRVCVRSSFLKLKYFFSSLYILRNNSRIIRVIILLLAYVFYFTFYVVKCELV